MFREKHSKSNTDFTFVHILIGADLLVYSYLALQGAK